MITFDEWKKALEDGKSQMFIVSKEHKIYDGFYCLGATDYVFDKHGNTYICIGRTMKSTKNPMVDFFKTEDCFLDRKEAEIYLARSLGDSFKAIKLTYEDKGEKE